MLLLRDEVKVSFVDCHLVAWLYNILYCIVFQRRQHNFVINRSGVFANGVQVAFSGMDMGNEVLILIPV